MTTFVLLAAALLIPGCAKIPKDALLLQPESLANRQLQTRRFDTANFETMLGAASAVFQDLGFSLDEAEYRLGILVGSKRRDATSGGQVAGAIFLAVFTGVAVSVDEEQIIRASVVMREIDSEKTPPGKTAGNEKSRKKDTAAEKPEVGKDGASTVRVTFQRVIYNTQGQVSKLEQINEPSVYREFFDKLAQAVFLEAHEI
ncbi:MAG: hypothetical protein LBN96_07265 [Desulfovibrio sp.]|nr:hypothetical protein [Desulfovibrio sp.]